MRKEKYWRIFEKTGSIEDYLNYRKRTPNERDEKTDYCGDIIERF